MRIVPDDNPTFFKPAPSDKKTMCCCGRHYRYRLEPLRTDGMASLVCSDAEGIQEVSLIELQYYWGGPFGEIEIRKSKNYLASMKARNKEIPDNVTLSSATFMIKFGTMQRPRTVQIRPPLVAVYEREADRELVEEWFMKRGFLTLMADGDARESEQIMEHV